MRERFVYRNPMNICVNVYVCINVLQQCTNLWKSHGENVNGQEQTPVVLLLLPASIHLWLDLTGDGHWKVGACCGIVRGFAPQRKNTWKGPMYYISYKNLRIFLEDMLWHPFEGEEEEEVVATSGTTPARAATSYHSFLCIITCVWPHWPAAEERLLQSVR